MEMVEDYTGWGWVKNCTGVFEVVWLGGMREPVLSLPPGSVRGIAPSFGLRGALAHDVAIRSPHGCCVSTL